MKHLALVLCTSTLLISACSNDATPGKNAGSSSGEPSKNVNLFDNSAFKASNANFENSTGQGYSDTDTDGYAVLDAGSYSSTTEAMFRVCARLDANGANSAIRIRGNGGKLLLTAIPVQGGVDVSLKVGKGEGEASLENGKTCVSTASLPAGTEMSVSIYPAISVTGGRYDKSATGDLRVDDVVVEWIAK